MLIEDGICEVPWEVLRFKKFYVGCVAGELLTSDAAVIDVTPCGVDLLDPNLEPTPTLFYAIMKKLQDAEQVTEEQIAEAVKQYLDENPTEDGGDPVENEYKQPVILAVGDSLCKGSRNNGKGFVGDIGLPYFNYGVDGATLGENNLEWQGVIYPLHGENIIRNQLTKAIEDGVEADIIIADGCINDYSRDTELGIVPSERIETDEQAEAYFDERKLSETIGGLEKLFFDMWKYYPKARKFFIIPHKLNNVTVYGSTESVDYMNTDNDIGYTLTRYYDAIKGTCAVYGIEVIDVCNESKIDMNDPKYNPGYSWVENANNPNRDFETSTIWLDQDSHPFSYGYTQGYLPLIQKALFGDIPEEGLNNLFIVPIKYDGSAYTLDGTSGSDILSACNEGKYLLARIAYQNGVYYAGCVQHVPLETGGIKFDFSKSNTTNPSGRGFYSLLTNGIATAIIWCPLPDGDAKNVSCNITIGGEQKTNVADALTALAETLDALGIAEEVAY